MAYENIRLNDDELKTYIIPSTGRKVTPRVCTMDREKGYLLYNYFTDREDPRITYFIFIYKNKVIDMILDGEEFVDCETRKWKLISISIPKWVNKKKVLIELREAIKTYGCFGMTSKRFNCGKAVIDF